MLALAEQPQQKTDLIKNVINLQNANLTAMAALALLSWDWLISIDREVKHFWRAKWTLGTWLYFANRIIPTLGNLVHITTTVVSWTPEAQERMCKPTLLTLGTLSSMSFSIVQVVMSLRTYALYDCNGPLLALLLFLSVANMVNQVFWVTYPKSYDVINTLPAPYNGCLLVGALRFPMWAKYIPLLVFEALVLALTLYKFMIYVRSGSKALVPKVLFRDGFIGFVAVTLVTVFGVVILIERPRSLLTLGQILASVIPVLVASHMLLNLRDVMRMSSTVVGSSTTMVPINKFGTGKNTGPKTRESLQHYVTNRPRISAHLDADLRPGTKGTQWSASTGTMTSATEEGGPMPMHQKSIHGLHDVSFAGHQVRGESGGDGTMQSSYTYASRDPYAYGASDSDDDDDDEDDDGDDLLDESRHRHRHVPVTTRHAGEDIELGARISVPIRAYQGIMEGPSSREGEQDPRLRTTRRTPGRPVRDDRDSDRGSVLIIE